MTYEGEKERAERRLRELRAEIAADDKLWVREALMQRLAKALPDFAREGDAAACRLVLSQLNRGDGDVVNRIIDEDNFTPFHCAVESGSLETVNVFLEFREALGLNLEAECYGCADDFTSNNLNCTPFLQAAINRNVDIMLALAEAGADVNVSGGVGHYNALTHALTRSPDRQNQMPCAATALAVLGLPGFTAIDAEDNAMELPALQLWSMFIITDEKKLTGGSVEDWLLVLAALLEHPALADINRRFSDGVFGPDDGVGYYRGTSFMPEATVLHRVAFAAINNCNHQQMWMDAYALLVHAGADESILYNRGGSEVDGLTASEVRFC